MIRNIMTLRKFLTIFFTSTFTQILKIMSLLASIFFFESAAVALLVLFCLSSLVDVAFCMNNGVAAPAEPPVILPTVVPPVAPTEGA